MVRHRVRIRFSKQGDLRLISHRDLVRTFERMFRRAGLALSMSEGFHPKAKMSFPSALALGIEGANELMEVELSGPVSDDKLLQTLSEVAPEGLSILSATSIVAKPKGRLRSVTYELPIPQSRQSDVAQAIQDFVKHTDYFVDRPRGKRPVDLRAGLKNMAMSHGTLRIEQQIQDGAIANPREILSVLGLDDLEAEGYRLTRTQVEVF